MLGQFPLAEDCPEIQTPANSARSWAGAVKSSEKSNRKKQAVKGHQGSFWLHDDWAARPVEAIEEAAKTGSESIFPAIHHLFVGTNCAE